MSYTESDVIEHIYGDIKDNVHPLYHILKELIRWYEHEKILAEVNDNNTDKIKEKIKNLRNML